MAAEVIGLALLGLPGGRLLGRLGARRTMMLCDGARAPLMLVIPVLHWTVGISFATTETSPSAPSEMSGSVEASSPENTLKFLGRFAIISITCEKSPDASFVATMFS